MSRILRILTALAILAPAAAAFAFVRTTTTRFRPDLPPYLWWSPRQITFFVNASGFKGAGCASPVAAAALARSSFLAWENATHSGASPPCTDVKFNDCGDTARTDLGHDQRNPSSNINLVVFRSGECSAVNDAICTNPANGDLGPCAEKYNCWPHDVNQTAGDIVALTTVTFKVDTGEIIDADMELNGWTGSTTSPAGFYFTCSDSGQACPQPPYGLQGCINMDVGNAVTHEVGHMLGYDHVCVASYPSPYNACSTALRADTMFPSARPGDLNKRLLKPDDVEAVCTVYPVGQPTLTVPPSTVPASGPAACVSPSQISGGCGAAGGGLSLLGLALGLWLRGRRPHLT